MMNANGWRTCRERAAGRPEQGIGFMGDKSLTVAPRRDFAPARRCGTRSTARVRRVHWLLRQIDRRLATRLVWDFAPNRRFGAFDSQKLLEYEQKRNFFTSTIWRISKFHSAGAWHRGCLGSACGWEGLRVPTDGKCPSPGLFLLLSPRLGDRPVRKPGRAAGSTLNLLLAPPGSEKCCGECLS
jgi:hypothetical protein